MARLEPAVCGPQRSRQTLFSMALAMLVCKIVVKNVPPHSRNIYTGPKLWSTCFSCVPPSRATCSDVVPLSFDEVQVLTSLFSEEKGQVRRGREQRVEDRKDSLYRARTAARQCRGHCCKATWSTLVCNVCMTHPFCKQRNLCSKTKCDSPFDVEAEDWRNSTCHCQSVRVTYLREEDGKRQKLRERWFMRFPMRMRNQEEGVGVGGEWEECRAAG